MRTASQKVGKHFFSIVCTLRLLGGTCVKLYFVQKHFLDSLVQFLHYAPWNLGVEITAFSVGSVSINVCFEQLVSLLLRTLLLLCV